MSAVVGGLAPNNRWRGPWSGCM